jgi:hypothetical protein
MSQFHTILNDRFGAENIEIIEPKIEGNFPLIQIKHHKRSNITIVMTDGLRDFDMPVPEKLAGRGNIELYFCLPNYWEINAPDNRWIFDWLQRLAIYAVEKRVFFAHGHTVPNHNPAVAFSNTMNEKYLLLLDPEYLKNEMTPIMLDDKTVHFLAITPIFEDEMDYKMGKGTNKLQKKLLLKGITELLDDYRSTALKTRWSFFKK